MTVFGETLTEQSEGIGYYNTLSHAAFVNLQTAEQLGENTFKEEMIPFYYKGITDFYAQTKKIEELQKEPEEHQGTSGLRGKVAQMSESSAFNTSSKTKSEPELN